METRDKINDEPINELPLLIHKNNALIAGDYEISNKLKILIAEDDESSELLLSIMLKPISRDLLIV